MIKVEDIIKFNHTKLEEGSSFSLVVPNVQADTYLLKSVSGKEYIYVDGEIFYHSTGEPIVGIEVIPEAERPVNKDGIPIKTRIKNLPAAVFVNEMPQDLQLLSILLAK